MRYGIEYRTQRDLKAREVPLADMAIGDVYNGSRCIAIERDG
jgi:hypothetical protein